MDMAAVVQEAKEFTGLPDYAYPYFAQEQAGRDRWVLCLGVAMKMFETTPDSPDVQAAARSLFFSDIPVG